LTLRLLLARRSADWPWVEGELRRSAPHHVEELVGLGRGTLTGHYWEARLRYQYIVNGQRYSGSDRTYVGPGTLAAAALRRWVPGIPRRSTVRVYYDPEAPQRAVLEPGARRSLYLDTVLAWLGVGVALLLAAGIA